MITDARCILFVVYIFGKNMEKSAKRGSTNSAEGMSVGTTLTATRTLDCVSVSQILIQNYKPNITTSDRVGKVAFISF